MSKIVILGCGGEWTRSIISDLALTPSLHGAEVALVDINEVNLGVAEKLARRISDDTGARLRIQATADRAQAFPGADFVLAGISVGGYKAWEEDIRIPWEQFRIKQTVGDTMGPGGVFRALRHIPVFMDIASDMRRLCPEAWMIQLTNPMTPICRALEKRAEIRMFGYCHGVDNTEEYLAGYFGIAPERLRIYGYGVNHFLFVKSLMIDGKDGMRRLDDIADQLKRQQPSLYRLWKAYDAFPINRHFHPCEFVPFFLGSRANYGEEYGLNTEIPDFMIARSRNVVPDIERELAKEGRLNVVRSREYICNIMESMLYNRDFVVHLNVRNSGSIANVPPDCNVEVPAVVNGRGYHPLAMGELPFGIDALVRRVVDEQEMMVEAALTGSRKLAVRALAGDPLVNDLSVAEQLFEALYAAQKQYLPQFS